MQSKEARWPASTILLALSGILLIGVGGGSGSVCVAAVDHHTGTVLRQQGRDGRADAPRSADHDGAAVG